MAFRHTPLRALIEVDRERARIDLRTALHREGGNKAATAARLGIAVATLDTYIYLLDLECELLAARAPGVTTPADAKMREWDAVVAHLLARGIPLAPDEPILTYLREVLP